MAKLSIFVFLIIGFLPGACKTYETVNTSLNGAWNRDDIEISIKGNNGVFTQINSNSYWARVQNNGLIKIGDNKLTNITQTGNLKWTAKELVINAEDFTLNGWIEAEITMEPDGKTIHILSLGDNISNNNNAYTRVNCVFAR